MILTSTVIKGYSDAALWVFLYFNSQKYPIKVYVQMKRMDPNRYFCNESLGSKWP